MMRLDRVATSLECEVSEFGGSAAALDGSILEAMVLLVVANMDGNTQRDETDVDSLKEQLRRLEGFYVRTLGGLVRCSAALLLRCCCCAAAIALSSSSSCTLLFTPPLHLRSLAARLLCRLRPRVHGAAF